MGFGQPDRVANLALESAPRQIGQGPGGVLRREEDIQIFREPTYPGVMTQGERSRNSVGHAFLLEHGEDFTV